MELQSQIDSLKATLTRLASTNSTRMPTPLAPPYALEEVIAMEIKYKFRFPPFVREYLLQISREFQGGKYGRATVDFSFLAEHIIHIPCGHDGASAQIELNGNFNGSVLVYGQPQPLQELLIVDRRCDLSNQSFGYDSDGENEVENAIFALGGMLQTWRDGSGYSGPVFDDHIGWRMAHPYNIQEHLFQVYTQYVNYYPQMDERGLKHMRPLSAAMRQHPITADFGFFMLKHQKKVDELVEECVEPLVRKIQRQFRLWSWRKRELWNPHTQIGHLNLLIQARIFAKEKSQVSSSS